VNDLTAKPQSEREPILSAALYAEVNRPFDLEREPAFRAVLYRMGERSNVLQLTLHHVSSDGWSTAILFRDFSALYSEAATGIPAQLPELPIAFTDFARWQRQQLGGPEGERLIAYWKDQLQGSSFALQLPTDRPRPPLQTFSGANRHYALPTALGKAINSFCMREQVTPFMVLMAALDVVMARYSGQSDLLIGSAIAARSRVETEGLVGFFTNTILLRARLEAGLSFRELLHQVRNTALGAYAHQDLPLQLIIDKIGAERDPSRPALFQVMLILQNTAKRKFDFHGLDTRVQDLRNEESKFDLLFEIYPVGDSLEAEIEFNTDLFDPETIDRLWGNLATCIESAIAAPEEKVAKLSLLTPAERAQLLVEWNDTARNDPRETPLAALVEAQVERTPDAAALVFGEKRLTYRDLNQRANRLAHELRKLGAGPERLVAVSVNRSPDMIVALLAIVKTGGVYLPIDPLHPAKRIAYTFEDSGVQLLVTEKKVHASLPPFAGTTVFLEDDAWQKNSIANLDVPVSPDNLAYLLYTSGSTGNPKGVQIPRKALINLLWSMRQSFQLDETDRLLAVTTISFDISGLEVWVPLLVGAQIVIASREQAADGLALQALLQQHDITVLQGTPVLWRLLFDAGWRGKPNLQALCGGEAMPPEFATQLAPVVRHLWNLYGPTETTIWSTFHQVVNGITPISIGRPIANTQCYVLDSLLQLVPAGVPGDLYIGGDGLARGYFNRPELTAEKFIPDPFRGPEARMYKTGDTARYRHDGTIEFLGRNDQLVKIRGFRVEMGEIESALKAQSEIKQAVVIVREDTPGDKRLVAYMVASAPVLPASSELRRRLKQTLPEYSVPTSYIYLDRLPISPAGKIDIKALPQPEFANSLANDTYVAPRNRVEEVLAAIWAEVLKLPQIGIHDDFFEMGGDSFQAARTVVKVIAALPEFKVAIATMLKAPTVAEFAHSLMEEQADHSCLVALREGSDRAPFFCVPGVGANLFSVMSLATALPEEIPFYCIQARGLDGDSEPIDTVEETAEFNIELIKSVQPHGPYNLGGHCFGGLVAFEMARRLRAAGDEVGVVALIDTANTTYARLHLSRLQRLGNGVRFIVRRVFHHLHGVLQVDRSSWRRFFADRVNGIRYRLGPRTMTPNESEETIKVMEPVRYAGISAIRSYVPQAYDGHVLVFRARRRRLDPHSEDTLGWGRLALGGVTTVEIEGDHLSMLTHPQVEAVADRLESELRVWEPTAPADEQSQPELPALQES